MTILMFIGEVILAGFCALLLAILFGMLAGVYEAQREASFRNRALKLLGQNGQKEEFLIIAGDPEVVEQVYSVVVATTRRAQELSENSNKGIGLNEEDTEENTDRSESS